MCDRAEAVEARHAHVHEVLSVRGDELLAEIGRQRWNGEVQVADVAAGADVLILGIEGARVLRGGRVLRDIEHCKGERHQPEC